ncbi:MAG: hypothetical protein AAB319_02460, partial [Pseudomonadota bacterium]
MHLKKSASFVAATVLATCLAAAPLSSVAADDKGAAKQVKVAKNKLVIQVSDADPKKWALALNNAENVQEDLGKENVAYGPGLAMLKLESEVGGRVVSALEEGVKVVACENTMRKQKLTKDD